MNANLKAAALGRVGEFDEALELYEQVLQSFGKQPKIWMSYGHMLKTVGRQADAVTAYRRAWRWRRRWAKCGGASPISRR